MDHPRTIARLIAIAFLIGSASHGTTAELVVNGGFETGNFSGWTTTPASSGSLFGVAGIEPHTGSFCAFFGATQLFPDVISQTIPTVPGALYQVSFWLKNDGNPPNEFRVDFGGNNLADIGIQAPFSYTQFVFPTLSLLPFYQINSQYTVATSTSTVLQFRAYHSPAFWRLDDVSVMRICDPGQTGSQQFFPSEDPSPSPRLPLSIPEGKNGGDLSQFNFLTGTGTEFLNKPQATTASIYVCIDDFLPQNLKVIIEPLGDNPPASSIVTVWDHEQLVDSNNQPVRHIEALANLSSLAPFQDPASNPPTYSYKVQVLDDQPGNIRDSNGDFIYIGTFNSSVLTLNPNNPGHIGMPIVSLFGDEMFSPLPTTIEFGDPLSVFATAIGNPSSYKINRLGLKVVERVDLDPLHPDPAHPLLPFQQHNSGIGPGLYMQDDVAQSPASTTGVGLTFEPPDLPILPPGYYEVTATAWDSAGFSTVFTRNVTVTRSFGFLSVVNLARQVNTTCDETINGFPCNTATFSATLNLINNTPNDSGFLRVRLVDVPGSAFLDEATFTLPPERDFSPSEVSVGPVAPLLACSAQQVQVCGLIPAPNQTEFDFGIGHQVYAVLEQCDGTQAQCSDPTMPDLWIPVDTIRVTEGEWPVVAGFNGPGGGSNQDRRGGRGRNDPYVLDSLTIVGPATVASAGSVQFQANATLKKSSGAVKQLTNVRAQWSASMFNISSTGLFQAGAVTANTPVTITANYTFGGVTKSQTAQITVNAPTTASSATMARMLRHPDDEMADDETSDLATAKSNVTQKKKPKPAKPANITLSVSATNLSEGGSSTIMVTANKANATQPITIGYSLSGTAQLNTHYTICGDPGMITIPAGASSALIRLTAIANDLNLGTESVTITLSPGSGYKLPKKGAKATINITNVPPPLCP